MERKNTKGGARSKSTVSSGVKKPVSTRSKMPVSKSPLGLNVEVLEETFQALSPHAAALVSRFYDQLFEQCPDIVPLFANAPRKEQERKLLSALKLVINNLRSPDTLLEVLSNLGKRHQQYGALPIHYTKVARVLLQVMKEFAGDLWTRKAQQAWSKALSTVSSIMISAYDDREKVVMVANKKSMEHGIKLSAASMKEQVSKLQAIIDGAQTAVMTIDRNLVITYVNNATTNLLKTHEVALQQVYPGFSADALIGKCIDDFHKNPAHQRQIISDPNNFPYDTDINVGLLCFRLHVTAIYDLNGNYSGNTLEWSDITQKRAMDELNADYKGQIEAIGKSQGVIEFNMDGSIITANENFLNVMGFTLDEIQGKHHSMFAEPSYAASAEYKAFWEKLNRGEYDAAEYKRIGKGGKEVWIQASYNPIADLNGKYFKVVKYATDVTEAKLKNADFSGQLDAISKSQAVIEFNMDGTILTANDNFLNTVGYTLAEIQGKHHSMFAQTDYASSAEYRAFWERLNCGEFDAGEYKRIGKGGKEVWIQASYNPIIDLNGEPFKVVKYATDITGQKDALNQIQDLVNGAVRGELDARIDTEKYDGFVKTLGDGINVLVESVVTPIKDVSRVMKSLAEGDVTQTMEGDYSGEFAELRDSVNATMKNLLNIVSQIRESSGSITSAASEIAQGNQDLSQRTEEQAASLEQTAASMEELTSTVKQNADNAKQADQLSVGARDRAEKGGEVVSKAIVAMSEINASSKKIADIIGVIDEIAFQTNLLALNAAVEAARAGEQGRGFAVVASEVRSLAQRSAGAAKEIKTLIKDSVEKVEEGSRLVDQSGTTLGEIVSSVKKVGDIIAEIAAASQEQSAGIEEVNKAVAQMDETTQQNAALVEQAAAASESVNDQGNSLIEILGFFNVGAGAGSNVQMTRTAITAPAPIKRSPPPMSRSNNQAVSNNNDDEWEDF